MAFTRPYGRVALVKLRGVDKTDWWQSWVSILLEKSKGASQFFCQDSSPGERVSSSRPPFGSPGILLAGEGDLPEEV